MIAWQESDRLIWEVARFIQYWRLTVTAVMQYPLAISCVAGFCWSCVPGRFGRFVEIQQQFDHSKIEQK